MASRFLAGLVRTSVGGLRLGSALGARVSRGVHLGAVTRRGLVQPQPSVVQRERPEFNQPISGNELPRAGGVATMMRLPYQENDAQGLDACFVGIPMDIACSFRSGTRHGPRAIRHESGMVRPCNLATGDSPFQSINVGDIGDVPINIYSINKSMDIIARYYRKVFQASPNCVPLSMGGDHAITLPILRAMRERYREPLGLIQVDAHADLHDTLFGEKYTHGTVFRRALEEDLISPKHMIQIGLRGMAFPQEFTETFEWAQSQGVRMVFAHECWHKSLSPLMEEVQQCMGGRPVYFTFDIDGIDPAACPGTGTPEVGGLTLIQALEIIRGCKGLNIVGGDLVEVNPLYDHSGGTACVAYNLLFEMLCVLPGVKKYM